MNPRREITTSSQRVRERQGAPCYSRAVSCGQSRSNGGDRARPSGEVNSAEPHPGTAFQSGARVQLESTAPPATSTTNKPVADQPRVVGSAVSVVDGGGRGPRSFTSASGSILPEIPFQPLGDVSSQRGGHVLVPLSHRRVRPPHELHDRPLGDPEQQENGRGSVASIMQPGPPDPGIREQLLPVPGVLARIDRPSVRLGEHPVRRLSTRCLRPPVLA
jgi:hypothetical protein